MPPFFWSLYGRKFRKDKNKLIEKQKNSFQGVFLLYFIIPVYFAGLIPRRSQKTQEKYIGGNHARNPIISEP